MKLLSMLCILFALPGEESHEDQTGNGQTEKERDSKEIVKDSMCSAICRDNGSAGRIAVEWICHEEARANQADPK